MKKLICLYFLFVFLSISAQVSMGGWRTHFSYNSTSNVENTQDKVFGISNGALFSVSKEDNDIETYSKVSGLNDKDVSFIRYSESTGELIISYSNGNIDFLSNSGTIINVPDIKEKTISVDKNINDIMFSDGYAYLSCGIGIIKLNLSKKEISDTYVIGNKSSYKAVLSTAIFGDSIYALTSDGIYSALKTNSLLVDYNNWHFRNNLPLYDNENKQLLLFAGKLILLKSTGQVYYSSDAQKWNVLNDSCSYIKEHVCKDYLILVANNFVAKYDSNMVQDNFSSSDIQDVVYDESNDNYWIAGSKNGLQQVNNKTIVNSFKPSGPALNTTFALTSNGGRIFANTGHPRWWNADETDVKGAFMIFYDNEWHNWDEETMESLTGVPFRSLCYVAVDKNDLSHYYLSSLRYGLYEFKNDEYLKRYNEYNSTIEVASTVPSTVHDNYLTIDGAAIDNNNVVWVANELVSGSVKVMTSDGTWSSLTYSPIKNAGFLDKVIVSNNNYKWFNIPRNDGGVSGGIFVIYDNGYPTTVSQQKYKLLSSALDQDGNTVSLTESQCIVEDANNDMWVGTTSGIVLLQNVSNIFNSSYTVYRPKIARNDGTNYADYLLDGNSVLSIAVDGANRKWVSVKNAGVYLLSSDGLSAIHHFTEDNSPLLSNNVSSIAINGETGEVFFATDNGIISYMSDATSSNDNFKHINVYPNPVKSDFNGTITILGLMDESTVKVTDIYGNLVCQMKSNGGTATWDGRNSLGNRVKAGTYIIMGSVDDNGLAKSGIGKILILR